MQTCGARQESGRVQGSAEPLPPGQGEEGPPGRGDAGVPGGACGASPSAVPTRSSDRSISRRRRAESMVSGSDGAGERRGGGCSASNLGRSGSQRGGGRCFCRVSGPQRRGRAGRAFVEPGGEADSCPVSSVTRPPPCAGKCVRGRGIPRQAEPGPKLSPVARRG